MTDPYKEDATEKQVNFLKDLGYTGSKPKNKAEASGLITTYLLKQKCEKLTKLADNSDSIDQTIGLYAKVLLRCVENDITEPPVIGMIFNKECEKRNK